jgi:hypothetical protein
MDGPGDRLSFLGRPLPPGFELRAVAVAPGTERPYEAGEWRDALVVVERGELELVWPCRAARRLGRGEVLWLSGLSLRILRNRGSEPVLLVAIRRSRPPPPRSGDRREALGIDRLVGGTGQDRGGGPLAGLDRLDHGRPGGEV